MMNSATPLFRLQHINAGLDKDRVNKPNPGLKRAITQACRRIPPLWPLQHFVAVNPFLGLTELDFNEACTTMHRVAHGDMLMSARFYADQLGKGRINEADLNQAIGLSETAALTDPTAAGCKVALDLMCAGEDKTSSAGLLPTFADFVDEDQGTTWAAFIADEISKWCAAYFDQGQSAWRMPWRSLPLYQAWKRAALLDRNPEIAGLTNFRLVLETLPDSPETAIQQMLKSYRPPEENLPDFLHRQLMSVSGWSGWIQYQLREGSRYDREKATLTDLLAIRLAYDFALSHALGGDSMVAWRCSLDELIATPTSANQRLELLNVFQLAYEIGYQRELLTTLRPASTEPVAATTERKIVQAVFCIDVRSEVYRRALETVSTKSETLGFAGFFGFPIEYIPLGHPRGNSQCPVLISPKFSIRESVSGATVSELDEILEKRWLRKRFYKLWKSFKNSAVSCFSYVEIAGLLFGIKLFTDTLGLTRPVAKPGSAGLDKAIVQRIGPLINRQRGRLVAGGAVVETGIALSERIELARNALQGMGLTDNFARLVLLCGHGSSTVNNPYGSGLDCGACGGHSGEANARVAAATLNDLEVRSGLAAQGIDIPRDTWFVAGQHDTTTDEVHLFDLDSAPQEFAAELAQLSAWLNQATQLARLERAGGLGVTSRDQNCVAQAITARSHDWSQVRPEWGLTGNAAFIAAPRKRTQQATFNGRVFLHNYDARQDADGAILELIMTAPMVVASWINLQYYASTVNNRLFGSGNKVIHNVVGTFGILQGNGGDLQVGLPWQSIHDGRQLRHEPLRLTVLLEASATAIENVLDKHEAVRQLIDHRWLHLFRVDPDNEGYYRYLGNNAWQLIETSETH